MRYLLRLVTIRFFCEVGRAARWLAAASMLLCAGCSGLGVGTGGVFSGVGDLGKAAVACVTGAGPVPGAWTVLLVADSFKSTEMVLNVDRACAVTFGPVRP